MRPPVLAAAWILGTVSLPAAGAQAWTQGEGFRSAPLVVAPGGRPGFARVAPLESGIRFTNRLSALFAVNNQILENGAGVALGDVDGDGLCDVYFCGSENSNVLHRNLGSWRFEDVTLAAGVACAGQFSTGCLMADVDGDGDLDLLVNGLGSGTRLFLNDGSGRFNEARDSGLSRVAAATSMSMADVDGDGDLDLYVACYRTSSARNEPDAPRVTARVNQGRVEVTPADRFFGVLRGDGRVEVVEKGEQDTLYLNQGRGRFKPVPWTTGAFRDERGRPLTEPPEDWGLSVLMRDLTGDGKPDIYVCNDFFRSRDRFWVGDGRGGFQAADPLAWRAMPLSSMAVDAGDLNRDGIDDFLVVEMLGRKHSTRQRQRANAMKVEHGVPTTDPRHVPEVLANTLHLGRGEGVFSEVAWMSGLAATDWSWNVAFLDVDLDGWDDVLVATGNGHDVLDIDSQDALDRAGPQGAKPSLEYYPALPQRSLIHRNLGGMRFEEVGEKWGWVDEGIAQGMALADLDNDGDLDVVVGRLNQEAVLYRNESSAPRISVRLRGSSPNTEGVGARLRLLGPALPQQQVVVAGGRYLSADQKIRTFALPHDPAAPSRLEIQWSSGRVQVVSNVVANTAYEITEPGSPVGREISRPVSPGRQSWFSAVGITGSVVHRDEPFDELSLQPLLPELFSQRGPGVAWMDLDGDGREDLVLPSGRGGQTLVLTNVSSGAVARFASGPSGPTLSGDELMMLRVSGELITSTAPEPGTSPASGEGILIQALPGGVAGHLLTGSFGPMVLGDFDQDGDLDLWAGGRTKLGRFPESGGSALFVRDSRGWTMDPVKDAVGSSLQRVASMVATDLDGDGDLDLVAAVEWGGVQVLRNDRGVFTNWDPGLTTDKPDPALSGVGRLGQLTGFWHGVAAGDFDGDGAMDLVLCNNGRNQPNSALLPWHLYFGDFSGNGSVDLVEAFMEPGVAAGREVPWRGLDVMVHSLPSLRERFPTHRLYSEATVREVLGAAFSRAGLITVRTSESLVLLNRGEGFEARALPAEAQMSPAIGPVVADFDGDGAEDLFLSQNRFSVPPETPRSAAGRGLLLRGDGHGGFSAVGFAQSGIRVDGEQRGAATADFDRDGRPDLAVAQNRGPVVILRNRGGRPGLRVRLDGTAGNPNAVGASIRLRFAGGWGPRREVHAGGGYLSCDAPLAVLATPTKAAEIEVRWPDGQVTRRALVESEGREVRIAR